MNEQMFEVYLDGHLAAIEALKADARVQVFALVQAVKTCLAAGGKVLVCGNGGSAADAQHLAAELVGRFVCERRALPAIALTTDTSILSAVGNDYSFEEIFSRQVEALARPGDLVLGISTSGNSANVEKALKKARQVECVTAALLGRDGGRIAGMVDVPVVVRVEKTSHVQEAHLTILHLLCLALDEEFGPRG